MKNKPVADRTNTNPAVCENCRCQLSMKKAAILCRSNKGPFKYFNSRHFFQTGMGYVEYIVCLFGIVFMLFAPLPGQGGINVVDHIMSAIRAFGQNSSLLLSLP